MAINESPTMPPNNPIGFFTGTDDYMFTRRMALWLNQEYISIRTTDYDSISTLSEKGNEPWIGRDYVSINDLKHLLLFSFKGLMQLPFTPIFRREIG